MILGRIIGTVVASQKYQGLEGVRFMVVQPLNQKLEKVGDPVVAADSTQAGHGEIVYMVLSREASMALKEPYVPVDHAIVGIVDQIDAREIEELSD